MVGAYKDGFSAIFSFVVAGSRMTPPLLEKRDIGLMLLAVGVCALSISRGIPVYITNPSQRGFIEFGLALFEFMGQGLELVGAPSLGLRQIPRVIVTSHLGLIEGLTNGAAILTVPMGALGAAIVFPLLMLILLVQALGKGAWWDVAACAVGLVVLPFMSLAVMMYVVALAFVLGTQSGWTLGYFIGLGPLMLVTVPVTRLACFGILLSTLIFWVPFSGGGGGGSPSSERRSDVVVEPRNARAKATARVLSKRTRQNDRDKAYEDGYRDGRNGGPFADFVHSMKDGIPFLAGKNEDVYDKAYRKGAADRYKYGPLREESKGTKED